MNWVSYPKVAQSELARRWVEHHIALGYSPGALRFLARSMENYIAFLEGMKQDMLSVSDDIIAAYVQDLQGQVVPPSVKECNERHLAVATIVQRINSLKAFYTHLYANGQIQQLPQFSYLVTVQRRHVTPDLQVLSDSEWEAVQDIMIHNHYAIN